eukprot:g7040.t1
MDSHKHTKFSLYHTLKILPIILLFFINASAWNPAYINTNCPADPTFNDPSSCYGAEGINKARCVQGRTHLGNIYVYHEYAESLSLDALIFKTNEENEGKLSPYPFIIYNGAVSKHLHIQQNNIIRDNDELLVRNCVKSGIKYDVRLKWGTVGDYVEFSVPSGTNIFNKTSTSKTKYDFDITNIKVGKGMPSEKVGLSYKSAKFCHACHKDGHKWGGTCWGITPSSDSNRECGCNSRNSAGSGIFYSGFKNNDDDGCTVQSGGGFLGPTVDNKIIGNLASTSITIQVKCKCNDWVTVLQEEKKISEGAEFENTDLRTLNIESSDATCSSSTYTMGKLTAADKDNHIAKHPYDINGATMFDSLFFAQLQDFVSASNEENDIAAKWMRKSNENINTGNYILMNANKTLRSSKIENKFIIFEPTGTLTFQRVSVPESFEEYQNNFHDLHARSIFIETKSRCILTVDVNGTVTCEEAQMLDNDGSIKSSSVSSFNMFLTSPIGPRKSKVKVRASQYSGGNEKQRGNQVFFSTAQNIGRHGNEDFKLMWASIKGNGEEKCPKFFNGSPNPTLAETITSASNYARDMTKWDNEWGYYTLPIQYGKMGMEKKIYVGVASKDHYSVEPEGSYNEEEKNRYCVDDICESKIKSMNLPQSHLYQFEARSSVWSSNRGNYEGVGKFVQNEENYLYLHAQGFPMFESKTSGYKIYFDSNKRSVEGTALSPFVVEFKFTKEDVAGLTKVIPRDFSGTIRRFHNCITASNMDSVVVVKEYDILKSERQVGNVHTTEQNVGGWGKMCQCPDGSKYPVGDLSDSCGTFACFGGGVAIGECSSSSSWEGYKKMAVCNITIHEDSDEVLVSKCLALCEADNTKIFAVNRIGKCICYNNKPSTSIYKYADCLDEKSTSTFREFHTVNEHITLHFSTPPEIKFDARKLHDPVVTSITDIRYNGFKVHFTQPSDFDWGVEIYNRILQVNIIEKGINVGQENPSCDHWGNATSNKITTVEFSGNDIVSPISITGIQSMTYYCVFLKAKTPSRISKTYPKTVEINPPAEQRSSNSVYSTYSARKSVLYGSDSSHNFWRPKNNDVSNKKAYLQIDLCEGVAKCETKVITGIITEKSSRYSYYVTQFKVETSISSNNFMEVDEGRIFTARYNNGNVERYDFLTTLTARYIRFYPLYYNSRPLFRAGLIIETEVTIDDEFITKNVPETDRKYKNQKSGEKHAQSQIDSPKAWSAANNNANNWMEMDLGSVYSVVGVVTQGRGDWPDDDEWVKTYTISTSVDGNTWQAVESGKIFNGNTDENTKITNTFASIPARYVRLFPKKYHDHMSMRAAVLILGNSNRAVTDIPLPPSAPENLYVPEITSKSFTLRFSPPTSNGGLPIVNYTIYRQQVQLGGCALDPIVSYTSHSTVTIITKNDPLGIKDYKVYVKAENLGGKISEKSETYDEIRILEPSEDIIVNSSKSINAIQAGLQKTLQIGQRVFVPPATYISTETIFMSVDKISLISQQGSLFTTIDLQSTRFLYVDPKRDFFSLNLIQGFTFINGESKTNDVTGKKNLLNHGGAMLFFNVEHAVTMRDLIFKHNVVDGAKKGGAIAMIRSSGPFLMYDSIFKDNHARGGTYLENKGGAIAAMDGVDLRIENSTFINNTAVGDGGAILATNTFREKGKRSLLNFVDTNLEGNVAQYNGGAIVLEESDLEINQIQAKNNIANDGGVFYLGRSSLKLSNGNLGYNEARNGNGGAIYAAGSALRLEDLEIKKNTASFNGGAVNVVFSDLEIKQSTCTSNSARENGGGISATLKSKISVVDSNFADCTAINGKGGAIFSVENTDLTVQSSILDSCIAKEAGGVYVEKMEHNTKVKNSVFKNCSATGTVGGGGIRAFNTRNIYIDCTIFANNDALYGGGGGIYWSFPKTVMGTSTLESPIVFQTCQLLPQLGSLTPTSGIDPADFFIGNKASYGEKIASGPVTIIQTGGPSQDTTTSFTSKDTYFGTHVEFQTSTELQIPGGKIGTDGENFPTFCLLDFYGNIVNTNIGAVLTLESQATRVVKNVTNKGNFTDKYGILLSSPFFDGINTVGFFEQGKATFNNIILSGIPGQTYTGKLTSTVVDSIVSAFQITLNTCKPGTRIVPSATPICEQCDPGLYSDAINSFECTSCNAGQFSGYGEFKCTDCDKGKYQDTSGAYTCIDCPINSISVSNGATICSNCPNGKFQPIRGSTSCKDCQEGQSRMQGESVCKVCESGKATNGTGTPCNPCAIGTVPNVGATLCVYCKNGEYTNIAGSSSCLKCGKNKRGNHKGGCVDCKTGQYQDQIGQNKCKFCPGGRYRELKQDNCEACFAGQATNGSGTPCKMCLPGLFASQSGARKCSKCPSGKITTNDANIGAINCEDCPKFMWTKKMEGQTSCTKCQLGEIYAPDKNCHTCSPGKFSTIAAETMKECHECPAGGYCPGGSIVLPKAGWWMSNGRKSTEDCFYNASNLPKACGRNGIECISSNDKFSGEFYNECGVKQRIIKCNIQDRETFGHVCNSHSEKYTCNDNVCAWKGVEDPTSLIWSVSSGWGKVGQKRESNNTHQQCVCNDMECYIGKMCEKCALNFAKYGKYQCRACVSKNMTLLVFVLIFLSIIIAVSFYVKLLMNTVGLSETTSSGVKIVMNALQLSSLCSGFPMQWPGLIMDMFSAIGFASTSSDSVLQFNCILQDAKMPVVYQQTIFIAILPLFSVVLVMLLITISHKYFTLKEKLYKHSEVDNERAQFKKERLAKAKEKQKLLQDLNHIAAILKAHHKYNVRTDTVEGDLNKGAVKALRETLAKASRHGINIEKSVDHFYDKKAEVIDVRHCVRMLKDWDFGLTEPELLDIQNLLDKEGDFDIKKEDFLQYDHELWDRVILAMSIVLYLQYPLLCKTALSLLGCRSDLEHGMHEHYLEIDYEVPCYDTAHLFVISFVIFPMVILYIIGIPGTAMFVLLRDAKVAKGMGGMSDKVRYRYGLFTDGYKLNYIWWEGVVAVRKAFVIFVSVFFSNYGAIPQVYAGIFVVGTFLAFHMSEKPFSTVFLNTLESYGLVRKSLDEAMMIHRIRRRTQQFKNKLQNNVKNKKSTAVVPSMSSTKEANEIKARKFWTNSTSN